VLHLYTSLSHHYFLCLVTNLYNDTKKNTYSDLTDLLIIWRTRQGGEWCGLRARTVCDAATTSNSLCFYFGSLDAHKVCCSAWLAVREAVCCSVWSCDALGFDLEIQIIEFWSRSWVARTRMKRAIQHTHARMRKRESVCVACKSLCFECGSALQYEVGCCNVWLCAAVRCKSPLSSALQKPLFLFRETPCEHGALQ